MRREIAIWIVILTIVTALSFSLGATSTVQAHSSFQLTPKMGKQLSKLFSRAHDKQAIDLLNLLFAEDVQAMNKVNDKGIWAAGMILVEADADRQATSISLRNKVETGEIPFEIDGVLIDAGSVTVVDGKVVIVTTITP